MHKRLYAILTLWGVTGLAHAAGFDCQQAQSRVEKTVCADPALSELDEHLARYYAGALRTLADGGAACLKADQARWLSAVRDACRDAACLRAVYLRRLSELDALQPGASAIQNMDLPRAPTLAWIVPPAPDKVAAPPNPKAMPFEATGALIDETAGNPDFEHGFVLRTEKGAVYPLVLLMFLDGKTSDHLSVWAKQKDATFLARGYAARDGKGRTYFEPSRCTFVYRMP